jgi:site-specific recombinase XerD
MAIYQTVATVHPHMLRHSTGYKRANDGHDTRSLQHYLGHENIMHTVQYTEMASDRFSFGKTKRAALREHLC